MRVDHRADLHFHRELSLPTLKLRPAPPSRGTAFSIKSARKKRARGKNVPGVEVNGEVNRRDTRPPFPLRAGGERPPERYYGRRLCPGYHSYSKRRRQFPCRRRMRDVPRARRRRPAAELTEPPHSRRDGNRTAKFTLNAGHLFISSFNIVATGPRNV